jgi:O-antigen/teichoic acid export membrane protein
VLKSTLHFIRINQQKILRLSKEGSWIVLGQILSVTGALLLVRVLTEHLSPAEYGQLSLGLTAALMVNQTIMGGIINGIGRYYSIAAEHGDLSSYFRATRRLMAYATLTVGGIAVLVIAGLWSAGYLELIGLYLIIIIFSITLGWNGAMSSIQQAARQRAIVALHSGADAWLKPALVVALLIWLNSSSTTIVIAYTLSILIVTCSQLLFLRKSLKLQGTVSVPDESYKWVKQVWQFSWPFSTWGIFTWMQMVSDRWALKAFATIEDVGQYTVLYQIGYVPIGLATGMMVSFLAPVFFQKSGDATNLERNASVHFIAWRITQLSLAAMGLVLMFTWVFHSWIFQLLVAENYRSVSGYLPWVVLAGGLYAAGQTLSLKIMAELRSKKMISIKIVTALIGTSANVIGAWLYGLTGVVSGLVAFSLIYFLWMGALAYQQPNH